MRTLEDVERSLTNQAPINDRVVSVMETLREPARAFAQEIIKLVPDGREQSLALTHLEETVMWAIKGIALNQDRV